MAGKGSTRRPTDEQRYGDNYDAIFKKRTPEQQEVVDAEMKVWITPPKEQEAEG